MRGTLGFSTKRQRQAKVKIERQAMARKREAFRAAHPEVRWLEDRVVAMDDGAVRYDDFLLSLRSQFNRKAELSEKQLAALVKSQARQAEWDAERAKAKADEPAPSPVPEADGRIETTGKVLSSNTRTGPTARP